MTVADAADLDRLRGAYGIDAPYVPLRMGVGAVAAIAISVTAFALSITALAMPAGYIGAVLALSVADYLYTSRYGKFAVWAGAPAVAPPSGR